MVSHHEQGMKNATSNSKRPTDNLSAEEKVEVPKANPMRQKLALIGRYISLGAVPALSVISLAIGVFALAGNRSEEEQLSKSNAKIESLSATLSASKMELEKLKAGTAQEKNLHEEERKKSDERIVKIVQNITPLQVKLKIFPTLEDQLRQEAIASAVLPAAASNVVATSTAATAAEKKPISPVQVMKEAIEKYNKNN